MRETFVPKKPSLQIIKLAVEVGPIRGEGSFNLCDSYWFMFFHLKGNNNTFNTTGCNFIYPKQWGKSDNNQLN